MSWYEWIRKVLDSLDPELVQQFIELLKMLFGIKGAGASYSATAEQTALVDLLVAKGADRIDAENIATGVAMS